MPAAGLPSCASSTSAGVLGSPGRVAQPTTPATSPVRSSRPRQRSRGRRRPGRRPLPAPAVEERLEAAGIGADDEVVAYDDAIAAHLWWMLDDLGHERCVLERCSCQPRLGLPRSRPIHPNPAPARPARTPRHLDQRNRAARTPAKRLGDMACSSTPAPAPMRDPPTESDRRPAGARRHAQANGNSPAAVPRTTGQTFSAHSAARNSPS